MIKLNFTECSDKIEQGIHLLEQRLGFVTSPDGIKVNSYEKDNGLYIKADKNGVLIEYTQTAEFFRGLAIIMHNLKNNNSEFEVHEHRHFDSCGAMVDVSRNASLKVDTIKDIIIRMSLMGHNLMMLYTEDTYRMEKYPYFGYMRGAYSKEEIKELDKFANIFGIEMVPCIQTLGHLARTLRWPYAAEMKDTESVLLIDEPKTYEFIEEMIKTASECYSTKKIHIGMDEAHDVGFGQFFIRFGYKDRFEILSRHLTKVKEITDKYNFEPMMWSDMFFRLGSETGEYHNVDAVMPDDISEKIPQGISMVYWDYYNNTTEAYRAMLDGHKQMERDIVFAGGIWTWNGIAINYGKTFITTKSAMKACRERNIKNAIATLWGDDGAECSIYTALLGMQLYAEYNYYEDVDDDHLKEMFKICTGYDMDAYLLFDVDNFDESIANGVLAVTASKQVLYQDVLQGLFDKNFEKVNLKEHYLEIEKKLENINSQGDMNYLFDYQKQLVRVLREKCDIGIRISYAYKNQNLTTLKEIVEELKVLYKDIEILHKMFSEIWLKNNKAFGLDRIDLRFGGLLMRVKRAEERINSYISGTVDKIDELEEEKLFYNGDENPFVHDYSSTRIMSV